MSKISLSDTNYNVSTILEAIKASTQVEKIQPQRTLLSVHFHGIQGQKRSSRTLELQKVTVRLHSRRRKLFPSRLVSDGRNEFQELLKRSVEIQCMTSSTTAETYQAWTNRFDEVSSLRPSCRKESTTSCGENIVANSSPERVVFFSKPSVQFDTETLRSRLVVKFDHKISSMGTIHQLMHPGVLPDLKGSHVTFKGAHQLKYLVVQ
ncbi:uncharacterized protein ARMOST_06125 [Armillaria ostoyae]|uniref:Uncharacterized protein n=1 Tax=Armillaria ostoyae TaxID=47428 RepID=A0A284R248_ARMOS|nr:uncharacterized protein ARMOST_06125 [Armillaria ostoyae]